MDQTHAVNCDIAAKPDWLGLCLPFKLGPEPSLKFKGGKDVFGRGACRGRTAPKCGHIQSNGDRELRTLSEIHFVDY